MKKLLRKIRAKLSGTFVTDCPKCHQHFYGFHEYGVQMKINNKHYRIICHRCTKELKCLPESSIK